MLATIILIPDPAIRRPSATSLQGRNANRIESSRGECVAPKYTLGSSMHLSNVVSLLHDSNGDVLRVTVESTRRRWTSTKVLMSLPVPIIALLLGSPSPDSPAACRRQGVERTAQPMC